jgi:hypothetical protein
LQPVTISTGASVVEVGDSVVVSEGTSVVVKASVVAGSVSVVGKGVCVDDEAGLAVEGGSVVVGSTVLMIGLPFSSAWGKSVGSGDIGTYVCPRYE